MLCRRMLLHLLLPLLRELLHWRLLELLGVVPMQLVLLRMQLHLLLWVLLPLRMLLLRLMWRQLLLLLLWKQLLLLLRRLLLLLRRQLLLLLRSHLLLLLLWRMRLLLCMLVHMGAVRMHARCMRCVRTLLYHRNCCSCTAGCLYACICTPLLRHHLPKHLSP